MNLNRLKWSSDLALYRNSRLWLFDNFVDDYAYKIPALFLSLSPYLKSMHPRASFPLSCLSLFCSVNDISRVQLDVLLMIGAAFKHCSEHCELRFVFAFDAGYSHFVAYER